MFKSKSYERTPIPQMKLRPVETWLEVAAQAKKEPDPKKLIQLIETLCEALEQVRADRMRDYLRRNSIAA